MAYYWRTTLHKANLMEFSPSDFFLVQYLSHSLVRLCPGARCSFIAAKHFRTLYAATDSTRAPECDLEILFSSIFPEKKNPDTGKQKRIETRYYYVQHMLNIQSEFYGLHNCIIFDGRTLCWTARRAIH